MFEKFGPQARNCHSLSNARSIDQPLTDEEIQQYVDSGRGFIGRPWLEETFCGDHSDEFYRGLIAGLNTAKMIHWQREEMTWLSWNENIIRYVCQEMMDRGRW